MLYPDESCKIMGACFEVHNRLGAGFLEAVAIELSRCEVPFVAQPELELSYRDQRLVQVYRPDFICYDRILIEIKAVEFLSDRHQAQVINYLIATGLELGLLINFGSHPKLESKRLALTNQRGS